ncbi:hypothetical protein [Lentzea sp. NEAU-D7]|nr:hypothetical protein [Lentzea sp. NEAU-D7]MCX2948841.1 hypothetical protein [Lentzea sp. NEAU-D7]
MAARCAALLADPQQAEPHYVAALTHLDGTRLSLERARTQLLYGE